MRTEVGVPRSSCACSGCVINCMFMPGFLIPADLERMIPADTDPLQWAESNLLASPGALVMRQGETFRVNTLVPAIQSNGACINLVDGRCSIHAVAPFGCAFFSCEDEIPHLATSGILAVILAGPESLYRRIWEHLDKHSYKQHAPEVLRKLMQEVLSK